MENFNEQLALLPDYLSAHLLISLLAIASGIIVSVPIAILIAKWCKQLQWLVLTTAGVIQTIPSIAMLALMVLAVGIFGFWPAFIALMLYSILPILRNTTTALDNVDPTMTEAARGLGMTPAQSLWKVELPLAMPVIIAGIRTATVWVVGIATLSTPVGQDSLGNYIFAGLQTRNLIAVGFGVVAAAVLAIILDTLIAMLQQGVENRTRWKMQSAGGVLVLLVGTGLFLPYINDAFSEDRVATVKKQAEATEQDVTQVVIGSKTFTEQYILAALLERRLLAAGYEVSNKSSLGSGMGFAALANDQIDLFVDYSGTIYANYMKREDVRPGWYTLLASEGWMAEQKGVRSLGPLGFENAYALAMTRKKAEELGIVTISDLAKHAPDLVIGSDYEFFARPEWYNLRDTYGLNFSKKQSMDSSLMYDAVANGEVDVITAFSSDGRIAAFDLVVLDDPRNAFPPYDAMLLMSPRVASDRGLARTLRPLIDRIDVTLMRKANQRVDVDGESPKQAAAWLDEQLRQ